MGTRQTTAVIALALVVAGGWAYSTSFTGVFISDDIGAIVENPHIKAIWPLTSSMAAPRDTTMAGRPVAALTLAVNHALAPADARDVWTPALSASADPTIDPFYRNVWGYHALNLTAHLVAGLVLFGVVRRTLASPLLAERFGRVAAPLASVIVLMWLVHPLQTAAVTYVVQRVEVLTGLFLLLTLYCAIRATDGSRRGRWWLTGSILACALGMGAKETMVVAPLIVALWLWVFRREPERAPTNARVLLAGLAGTWILLAALVLSVPRSESVGFNLGGWTWHSYLLTQAGVITHYLQLVMVPTSLAFTYDWRPASSWMEIAPYVAWLSILGVLTAVGIARRRPVAFLGGWFFLILAPSSSILPIATEVAAEHRMYLPLAAVIALVVLGAYALGRRVLDRVASAPRTATLPVQIAAWLVVVAIVTTSAMLTHTRNRDYSSGESLMRDTVEKRPLHVPARVQYGAELLKLGRYAEAESQLRIALTLSQPPGAGESYLALAHFYLGAALCADGHEAEGIPHLQQALALNREIMQAYGMLAEALASQGQRLQAAAYVHEALERTPDVPPLLDHAAWLLATSPEDNVRNGAKAIEYSERAVRLTNGRNIQMLRTLAAAYAEQDRFQDAIEVIEHAQALAQGTSRALPALQSDAALYRTGRKLRVPGR